MYRSVLPDNRGSNPHQAVATSLESVFADEENQIQRQAHLQEQEARQISAPESELTIVRAFTDTFPQEEAKEDIEAPHHINHHSSGCEDGSSVPLPTSTPNATVTPQSSNTVQPSLSIPLFRPNIVAVTATPANDECLVGYETTPYGRWRSPLHQFYCQLYPSCLCSSILPCLVIAQLNHKFRQQTFYSILLYFIFGVTFLTVGAFLFKTPFVILLIVMQVIYFAFVLRQFTRKQFKIPGSTTSDCVASFCFPTCVLAQISRHIYDYKSPCEKAPLTVDGTTKGPPPVISYGRAIMRGTVPPRDIPIVRAAPRPHQVHPVIQTPPRQHTSSAVYVNVSFNTQMTPSTSHFNVATNTQQHRAIPPGQTPCAVPTTNA